MVKLKWIAVLVAFLVASTAVGYSHDRAEEAWDVWAQSVLGQAAVVRLRAESLAAHAAEVEQRADSVARDASERVPQVLERVRVVRELVTPDTCAPFVIPRDEAIDTMVAIAGQWEQAYDSLGSVADTLRVVNSSLLMLTDSMTAVLEGRPGPRPWWSPTPGLGLFAGVCSDRRACYGVGVTLSWKF